jgi:hypothetical protein
MLPRIGMMRALYPDDAPTPRKKKAWKYQIIR